LPPESLVSPSRPASGCRLALTRDGELEHQRLLDWEKEFIHALEETASSEATTWSQDKASSQAERLVALPDLTAEAIRTLVPADLPREAPTERSGLHGMYL
jgi:hypothetical protein